MVFNATSPAAGKTNVTILVKITDVVKPSWTMLLAELAAMTKATAAIRNS